jgi:hypothetical protein
LWLVVALASLSTIFLLVLSIPFDLSFRLDVNDRARFNLKLVWLFGLVNKELERKEKKAKPKKVKPIKAKEKKKGARIAIKILRTNGLLKQIKVLAIDLFNSLSIRQLSANFRLGLDNPADTGLLFAFFGPMFVFFNPPDRYSINIKPSFEDGAILEGNMQAVVRLMPIRLVIPLIKFVFSRPVFRIGKALFISKWKKK